MNNNSVSLFAIDRFIPVIKLTTNEQAKIRFAGVANVNEA
jgi:hypothetical protein